MTIDAKEDGVKVDNDEDTKSEPCTYPTTTSPLQQEMMASTLLETSSSIVVPTPSKNSTEGLEGKSITINGGDISIYSTDDGVNAANKTPNRVETLLP